jgi:hypothetical protein
LDDSSKQPRWPDLTLAGVWVDTRVAEDELHRSYDAGAAHRFWIALGQVHRVLSRFRAGFRGKAPYTFSGAASTLP